MKRLLAAAAALMAIGFAGNAYAFHSGGVAECEGCHTMHNSFENAAIATNSATGLAQFAAGPYLLKGSDQSSACLNCHQHEGDTGPNGYHISTAPADMTVTAPLQRTPGGDFGWLKKTYVFADRTPGVNVTNAGERHGHNIIAADYGYVEDATMAGTTSPGGTYPKARLACSSCHDPHGKTRRDGSTTGLPIVKSGSYPVSYTAFGIGSWGALGAYRLLRGPTVVEVSTGFTGFAGTTPPVALAPSTYNRSESASDTVVAYGAGMSEWCGACHGSMLQNGYVSGATHSRHPAGNAAHLDLDGTTIYTTYNNYVASGNLTGAVIGGNGHAGYTSLVPIEWGVTNAQTLQNAAGTAVVLPNSGAAQATSNVLCLSCHRAHASGFESMARYSLTNEFMTLANPDGTPRYPDGTVTTSERFASYGMNAAEVQAAYYDRAPSYFAPYQRNYCNKCHAKD